IDQFSLCPLAALPSAAEIALQPLRGHRQSPPFRHCGTTLRRARNPDANSVFVSGFRVRAFGAPGNNRVRAYACSIFTYSNSPGLLSMPTLGGAIHEANLPASYCGFIRLSM